MADPRSENARQFSMTNNKVTGVALSHISFPGSKWALVRASLVDEVAAQGQTVARVIVRDKEGIEAQVSCYLGWPWQGWQPGNGISNRLLPGNTNFPYEHIITNRYDPTGSGQGPLAIYIGDGNGTVQSDVIGGLGLPAGHHVSYHLVFQERNGDGPDGPDPDEPVDGGGTGGTTSGDVQSQLDRIERKLDRLSRHFGLSE
jgi:hypothetical protein